MKINHEHPMEKIGFDLDAEDPSNDLNRTNLPMTREQVVQKTAQAMRHANFCKDQNCDQPFCPSLKPIMAHLKNCDKRGNPNCFECEKFKAFSENHAKYCNDVNCPIPYCAATKFKLEQRRLREEHTLLDRVAFMNGENREESVSSIQEETTTTHVTLVMQKTCTTRRITFK